MLCCISQYQWHEHKLRISSRMDCKWQVSKIKFVAEMFSVGYHAGCKHMQLRLPRDFTHCRPTQKLSVILLVVCPGTLHYSPRAQKLDFRMVPQSFTTPNNHRHNDTCQFERPRLPIVSFEGDNKVYPPPLCYLETPRTLFSLAFGLLYCSSCCETN